MCVAQVRMFRSLGQGKDLQNCAFEGIEVKCKVCNFGFLLILFLSGWTLVLSPTEKLAAVSDWAFNSKFQRLAASWKWLTAAEIWEACLPVSLPIVKGFSTFLFCWFSHIGISSETLDSLCSGADKHNRPWKWEKSIPLSNSLTAVFRAQITGESESYISTYPLGNGPSFSRQREEGVMPGDQFLDGCCSNWLLAADLRSQDWVKVPCAAVCFGQYCHQPRWGRVEQELPLDRIGSSESDCCKVNRHR